MQLVHDDVIRAHSTAAVERVESSLYSSEEHPLQKGFCI